jgi:hypothetical protein
MNANKELLAALSRIEAIAHHYSRVDAHSDEMADAFKSIVDETSEAIAFVKKSNEPDLLAALIEYVEEFEYDMTPHNPRYTMARNAIAKAKKSDFIL